MYSSIKQATLASSNSSNTIIYHPVDNQSTHYSPFISHVLSSMSPFQLPPVITVSSFMPWIKDTLLILTITHPTALSRTPVAAVCVWHLLPHCGTGASYGLMWSSEAVLRNVRGDEDSLLHDRERVIWHMQYYCINPAGPLSFKSLSDNFFHNLITLICPY